ncbi:TIGR02530 family flagellar biosynthesis protein [Brevibacillus fulvus]|uniref:Flagellar operon protein n=1 Tax=Brevibacillus fulvus TaxID=1125967 RepID=A0A938Y2V5_9BACL|nr:TIGR02530 family flagellar biosynthesis protein [Brevibacillus fulvus]MBM7590622.1 flagellar operon protein [Brevibacillus fulvus]
MSYNFRVGQTYYPPNLRSVSNQPVETPVKKPFEQWLSDKLDADQSETRAITFSQHALNRLQQRSITLTDSGLGKLQDAVQKAADKGAKESLIMMDNVAYVVNIANRKVITVVDSLHMKNNLFTNIDSAIFV